MLEDAGSLEYVCWIVCIRRKNKSDCTRSAVVDYTRPLYLVEP